VGNGEVYMNSFIAWIGGKSILADTIVSMMPAHKTYIEVFGGAGWVLFRKEPSKVEVWNDLNSDLVNLFMVFWPAGKNTRHFRRLSRPASLRMISIGPLLFIIASRIALDQGSSPAGDMEEPRGPGIAPGWISWKRPRNG
jgi:hypothetical protein